MMISERPDATASSTTYWINGLSTNGSISLGCAFVAGRNRVPSPAAGKTALRICITLEKPLESAAVDGNRRPGNIAGSFGSEERHQSRKFFRTPQPRHRNISFPGFQDALFTDALPLAHCRR